jgi:hypothetical protein
VQDIDGLERGEKDCLSQIDSQNKELLLTIQKKMLEQLGKEKNFLLMKVEQLHTKEMQLRSKKRKAEDDLREMLGGRFNFVGTSSFHIFG